MSDNLTVTVTAPLLTVERGFSSLTVSDNSPRLTVINKQQQLTLTEGFSGPTAFTVLLIEHLEADPREAHHLINGPFGSVITGGYREIIGGVFPTSVIWYVDATLSEKIFEIAITRNANKTPSVVVYTVYEEDGSTILHQYTDTITYSGVQETSRLRVKNI